MWKWFKYGAAAGVLLFFAGCADPAREDASGFAAVILAPGEGASIRGTQLGDALEAVRKRETFVLTEEGLTHLIYESEVDINERPAEVSVYYNFDEFGLFEIQIDIFPEERADAVLAFDRLKTLLTSLYGAPRKALGGLRFTSYSPSNNVVEITLTDESAEAGVPFVSLNYLEPLDDEV